MTVNLPIHSGRFGGIGKRGHRRLIAFVGRKVKRVDVVGYVCVVHLFGNRFLKGKFVVCGNFHRVGESNGACGIDAVNRLVHGVVVHGNVKITRGRIFVVVVGYFKRHRGGGTFLRVNGHGIFGQKREIIARVGAFHVAGKHRLSVVVVVNVHVHVNAVLDFLVFGIRLEADTVIGNYGRFVVHRKVESKGISFGRFPSLIVERTAHRDGIG